MKPSSLTAKTPESDGPEFVAWATHAAGGDAHGTGDAPARRALAPGSVVGRYVVLSLLGVGGMGAVYAAHDPELDRKVALKVLRSGAGLTEGVRLLREARALAMLAHPNVVAVHDVGTIGEESEGAEIFIAMEFVAGVTARAWLCQRRRSLHEILDVFMAAARGLAAAHRAGLVHRDFKPDNMMIGADGRARVMDFGLARAEGSVAASRPGHALSGDSQQTAPDIRLTREGSLLGTPSYMAPEQWENDEVDARTDQFAFCVALWEALFGARPFRGGSVSELMASVTRGAIERPRDPERRVPAWLVWVLERGLSRAPERRFPTMDALLAELERGLSRRRWRPLAIGVVAVGLAIAGVFGLRARRAAACAVEGSGIAEVWNDATREALRAALLATGVPYAETSYQKALPRIDRWAEQWAATRTRVCTEAKVESARSPESYGQAVACLDEEREGLAALLEVFTANSAANVQRLVPVVADLPQLEPCTERTFLSRRPEPPGDPATRERLHALRRDLLRARGSLAAGDCTGMAQAESLLAAAEALAYRPAIVTARALVADLAECGGDRGRAEEELRRVYVEAEALRADEAAAAAAVQLLDTIGDDRGRSDEALQWSLPAEAIVQRLGQERGLLGARLLQTRAVVLRTRGELDRALADMEAALAIREEVLGPDHPLVASTLNALGNIHRRRESLDAALAVQTRALAIRKAALGDDHPAVATVANDLGLLEQYRARYDEARAFFAEALKIAESSLGADHLETAKILNNLGRLEHVRGDLVEARRLLERALAIREKKLGPGDLDVAVTLQNLGLLRLLQGERLEARALLERVLAIRERRLDDSHPELVTILGDLGTLNYRIGAYDEALALHERALAIQRRRLKPDHPDIAGSLRNLALVHKARGAHEQALALASEALAVAERALGPDHPEVASTLNALGLVQRRRDPAAAAATLERALSISVRARGRRHPATATSLVRLGEVYVDRGQYNEARASLDEALSIRESLGRDTPEVAEVLVALGDLALAQGRPAEAVEPLERAVQIRGKDGVPRHQLAEARFALARALQAGGADDARDRSFELALQAAEALQDSGAFRDEWTAVKSWLQTLDRGARLRR